MHTQPVVVLARRGEEWIGVAGPFVLEPGEERDTDVRLGEGAELRVSFELLAEHDGRPMLSPGFLRDAAGRDWTVVGRPRVDRGRKEFVYGALPAGTWHVATVPRAQKLQLGEGEKKVLAP